MQGGIVAYAWNTDEDSINNCSFDGTISGTNVGGIVGYIPSNGWGAIKNCVNNAKIIATGDGGGIIGHIRTNRHTFENCINHGTIEANSSGGIIGSNWQGNITIHNCYNNSVVDASSNAGGIVGYSYISYITMVNCGNNYNADIQGVNYAGGLFGRKGNYGNIYIYNSYNLSKVSSNNYTSGIGFNTKIENSYFAGTIEGGNNIGAISYSTVGTALNCYYINSASNADIEGITALSEEDMKVNDTLFNSLKSYTNSEYELSEWKKDANQYPIHSGQ